MTDTAVGCPTAVFLYPAGAKRSPAPSQRGLSAELTGGVPSVGRAPDENVAAAIRLRLIS